MVKSHIVRFPNPLDIGSQAGTLSKATVLRTEMEEDEKNINSLLPLEMLDKIFRQLSFQTLKVKFAFPGRAK